MTQTLGLLASYRSGLSVLKKTGQDQRLITYYFKEYIKLFDRIYYFSYTDDLLSDYTSDPEILAKVILVPKPAGVADWKYALGLSHYKPEEFSACQAFRVYQSLGIMPLIGPWLRRRCPPNLTTFGYRYALFAKIEKKAFWKITATVLVEHLASHLATVMLVTTPELFQYVQKFRGSRPIALIPNGVDSEEFKPNGAQTHRSSEKKTILFIGRFERQKNLENLIAAASRLTVPSRLLFIGRGSLEPRLRESASQSGVDLQIAEPVSHTQLPSIMQSADVFALLSWAEGHPKVLLEAMAAALPCVVADSEGIRTLARNGQTAYLCDPTRPENVATILTRILSQPEESRKIGSQARRYMTEAYDLRRFVAMETNLLNQLAQKKFSDTESEQSNAGPLARWLTVSCRRRLLDLDLACQAYWMRGNVLEIGGGRGIHRGRFQRPVWQTLSWRTLNRSASAQPDFLEDVQSMSLPDESADCLVCLETLEYVEDPAKALAEMRRVLTKEGILVLSIPYLHRKDRDNDRWRFTRSQLTALISKAGFDAITIHSQGGPFAAAAHALKSCVSRQPHPWVRRAGSLLLCLPVEGLMMINALWQIAGLPVSLSTGFLVVARRRENPVS